MPCLGLIIDSRITRTFPIDTDVVCIGRADTNDITIGDITLSRLHAEIRKVSETEDIYAISDLQSHNGVYINRTRISNHHILEEADVITLGAYSFVFTQALFPVQNFTTIPNSESEGLIVALYYTDYEVQQYAPTKAGKFFIGRGSNCDLQIIERRLSRQHCCITYHDQNWHIEDLRSQNGTYLNGKKVVNSQVLQNNDILNFAYYSVRMAIVESAAATKLTPATSDLPTPAGLESWLLGRNEPSNTQSVSLDTAGMKILTADLPSNKTYRFEVIFKDQVIQRDRIQKEVIVLGSSPDVDIYINGLHIPKKHSLLVRIEDALLFTQLEPSVSVKINNEQISQQFVVDGDQISIGETTICIYESNY